ncbi:MAG: HAD hydrolase family protein [Actinomycetota bacterium]|nr:HAD hydrolase family protein [Actinomycetota bacterium]
MRQAEATDPGCDDDPHRTTDEHEGGRGALLPAQPATFNAPSIPPGGPNLLMTLPELGSQLAARLAQRDWDSAYLLAAAMNQVAEDNLEGPGHLLGNRAEIVSRVAGRLDRPVSAPALALMVSATRATRRMTSSHRRLADWQREIATLTGDLANVVLNPESPKVEPGRLSATAARLRIGLGALEPTALATPCRLPSCFHSFDQRPEDIVRLSDETVHRWPDRDRPLVVVGVRTSGSYLAPLHVARLTDRGFRAQAVTMRPGHRTGSETRDSIRRAVAHGGLVLLVDDPPATGTTLVEASAELERLGVPRDALVLVLAVFGAEALPARLQRYQSVLLPWERWSVHERLAAAAVSAALSELVCGREGLDPGGGQWRCRLVSSPNHAADRGHVSARYRAARVGPDGDEGAPDIFVEGTGLGYFGEHALAVAAALPCSPPLLGHHDGFLYRHWLPQGHSLAGKSTAELRPLLPAVVDYLLSRRRALAIDRDPTEWLVGQRPLWELTADVLSRSFGRGWPIGRAMAVDRIARRLLHVDRPCLVDGRMDLEHWFESDSSPGGLVKTAGSQNGFSNLQCFDPVYDLAALAASIPDRTLDDALRALYHQRSGDAVSPERWLLYMIALLGRPGAGKPDPTERERELSGVLRLYMTEVVLKGVKAADCGPVCALDVDGVLEGDILGFPALTPTAALVLRAMMAHGLRPVLASGRSAEDVRDRCRAWGLPGGVAEYGAVIYRRDRDEFSPGLLRAPELEALAELRAALDGDVGIHLDHAYRVSVRAFRLHANGVRAALDPGQVLRALAACRQREELVVVRGDRQTDFHAKGTDKAEGLRLLLDALGAGPLAAAVGDTEADLPMLASAERGFLVGHADRSLRAAAPRVTRRPYQLGLAEATTHLVGHGPGTCPICAPPATSSDTAMLLALLALQEGGKLQMARRAARLLAASRRG